MCILFLLLPMCAPRFAFMVVVIARFRLTFMTYCTNHRYMWEKRRRREDFEW